MKINVKISVASHLNSVYMDEHIHVRGHTHTNIHTNSLKAHFLFSVCMSRKYQLRAIMKQFPFTDEVFSLMGRASKWLVVGGSMAEHVEESKESCLKFSFYAWRTAVPRGPKEGGREHMFSCFFPQVLVAKETVSFVWHIPEMLEVDSNPGICELLELCHFNNGKLKRQDCLTEGREIPWNFCEALPIWGEKSKANKNSLFWNSPGMWNFKNR